MTVDDTHFHASSTTIKAQAKEFQGLSLIGSEAATQRALRSV
jgi:hypothetical protein